MSIKIVGSTSGNIAEVNSTNQLKIVPETSASARPSNIGGIRNFSENDEGTITGTPYILSPETDDDYRLRVSQDIILDDELFNYTAQNTGKHTIVAAATNLVPSWTGSGYNTNPTGVITTTSGATLRTYAMFSYVGTGTLSVDTELAFTAQPTSNTTIDWGLFQAGASNPFAPVDGVYFRLNASGLQGILNYNNNETSTGVFPLSNGTGTWVYTNNKKYQFIMYVTTKDVEFWVNDGSGAVLLGSLDIPSGQGTAFISTSQPFAIRHAIVGGAAGASISATLSRYNIRLGGIGMTTSLGDMGNRTLGSYQGLSGGTMGSLVGGTVTTGTLVNPTAAVPTNTTAALGTGLGGQFWETASLAVNTDGVISSYQVPAGSTTIQGRRLKLYGVMLNSYIQTVIVGGPYAAQFQLAFGHTNVSLQTAEASTTKAPRRVMLPALTQLVTAAQAVSTMVSMPAGGYQKFQGPIYVNPGEFVQLVTKHVGTVGTSGTVAHVVQFDYEWE